MIRFTFLILLVVVFTSCDRSRIYADYENLNGVWKQDSTYSFSFGIEDLNSTYNLIVSLTNRSSYPYYNLYFNYELLDEADSVLSEKLEEILFFDPKTGRPKGSGSGNLFSHNHTILQDFKFDKAGTYNLRISHFMRTDSLLDIERVGLRVETGSE